MKQKYLLLLFALLPLFLAPSRQTFALSQERNSPQDSKPTATTETAVLMATRINNHRQELDLPAFFMDDSLRQGAQWIAETMAANEFISHYDDTGANPQQRAERAGYTAHVTEIIYGGLGGADAAWKWWIENDLHYGLLTSEDYVEFGVAMATGEQSGRIYWAVMFGAGDGKYNDASAEDEPVSPGFVTKLPPTSLPTSETAVPSPTSSLDPTATSVQVAANPPITNIADLQLDEQTTATTNNNSATSRGQESDSLKESLWLIIAALVTIIFGIAVFYFPRHGLSQKFKEKI